MELPLPNDSPERADQLVEHIKQVLDNESQHMQGRVVAEIAAIWLAGHDPAMRHRLMHDMTRLAADLVPVWHRMFRQKED